MAGVMLGLAWIFICFLVVSNLVLWLVCISQHKMILGLQGRKIRGMTHAEKQSIVKEVKEEFKAASH